VGDFYKYHGAGNDFIVIDNRDKNFDPRDTEKIKLLCHRRFGVGADGILLLENSPGYEFGMVYINSDGSMGSMCGNGGRCIVHFAHHILKIIKNPSDVRFLAVDGEHQAEINGDNVRLKMRDISSIGEKNNMPFVMCGTTPHQIKMVDDLANFPVFIEGRKIRNLEKDGVNTNFVEEKNGIFYVRTYERGIEDETMACGTGATSVAVAMEAMGLLKGENCNIEMPGGKLKVEFKKDKDGSYRDIWLTGEAKCVFKGTLV
jgi:diaminopimelate epimerase